MTAPVNPDWRPVADFDTLRRRWLILDTIRRFFAGRRVLEVDVPLLQRGANLDSNIVPMAVDTPEGRRWLPTSPEHPLKRLVAAGYGAVWTLAPAFRSGERGARHLPEFRMLEWYVPGWDDTRLADQVIELCGLVSGLGTGSERITWTEAYRRHAGFDPHDADDAALRRACGDAPAGLDRAGLLDLLMILRIQPSLERMRWTIIDEWPVEASAQAQIRRGRDGRQVAARFEIYRDGLEIANGYSELTDGAELRGRLEAERARRPEAPDLDERFLAAMAHGLPPCAGVAVGFERLVMLALRRDDIRTVTAFPEG